MGKIILHNPHLDERGTTQALWDYANGVEDILGHTAYIATPSYTNLTSRLKFEERFPGRVFIYDLQSDLQAIVDDIKPDLVYFLKYGVDDRISLKNVKTAVHCVFDGSQPHGDRYAAVSKWLGDKYSILYVPHIVNLPSVEDNYREHLGIPKDASVFGRHGGKDSFDDPDAHKAVYDVASRFSDKYFLFMNTDPFCPSLPNIIYLEPTIDPEEKTAFINTCDCMIHGRQRGETFGLSVCEFLHQGKPVITRINSPERHHIDVLGPHGYYYENYLELSTILTTFAKSSFDYRSLVAQFNPRTVMEQFNQVFVN